MTVFQGGLHVKSGLVPSRDIFWPPSYSLMASITEEHPLTFLTKVGWTKKCAQFWFPKEFLKLTSVRNCSHQSALLDKLFQNANIDFFLFHWKMYFFPGFSGFASYVCCGTLSYFHEGTFSCFPQVGLGEEADSSEIVLGPFRRDYYCKIWLQFNMFHLIQFNMIYLDNITAAETSLRFFLGSIP